MDSQADQPFGGGADPSEGGQQPGGQPWSFPPPEGGQPEPGTPQPGTPQPSTPQPGGPPQPEGQPWGSPQPGGTQTWTGPAQPGGMPQYPGQQVEGQQFQGPPQYGAPQSGAQPPTIAAMGGGPARVRPGRIWYLGAVLLVLGGVAWLVFGFVSLSSKVDAFSRVPLPAGGTVALNHSGGWVVYYEGAGAATGQIPGFNVLIRPAAPPAAVGSLRSYTASVTYTIGSHEGRAVLTFQVVHPGKFLVRPSGATAVASGSDLAFGSSVAGSIVTTVLLSIGLIFLGVAATIILFIIRLTRTRRARAQAGAY